MVNSGSFDSADGNRNGKTRTTQAVDAALGSQATNSIDDACKSDSSKSADEDLPSEEPAIEPTPSKTEINSVLPPKNAFLADAGQETAERSLPSEKNEKAAVKCLTHSSDSKAKSTRKLLCLYCDRTFVSANLRQKHVERVHSVKSTRRVSARRQNALSTTPCDHCDKLNSTEHTLNDLFQHLVQEHSTKYFGCLTCKERFVTSVHLADHYTSYHVIDDTLLPDSLITTAEPSSSENAVPHKLTRSKLRVKKEEPVETSNDGSKNTKKSKLKNLRTKKLSLKSSKITLKRSKRIQQQAKEQEISKKKRKERRRVLGTGKSDAASNSKQIGEKPRNSCVNPYPEFDSFYRVKKITDHSIDNLKISSLTFDDVFDKAFFNRIKCNIEENLLHHIDGKLFKNEESESRISNFEKITPVNQEAPNHNAVNYGCEVSLNAITPVPSISLNSQFGEDFESQIEYGSKPSKKKSQIKSDEVHYKYFTRRKYQASILQQKENRDLSKLDMWTQMVVKERQQGVIDKKKSAKEMQEYVSGDEYTSKIKRQELNKILDRRGPFEDLKEEASKKAAYDKFALTSGNDISQEVFTDVQEVLNELLNKVFDIVEEDEDPIESMMKEVDEREIPGFLNLRRKTSSTHEEIDKSDKIALICSSQETENFELPTNPVRGKNEFVELTGEWARSRMYICAACGGKFSNMKYLLDHKSLFHQNVWVQHYEFVGNQSELYRHLSIPGLGKVGVVEKTIPCKLWKRSDSRMCTKCGKRCNSLGELHRHVLECGGDWTWLLARKKYKYRPFRTKARRKRSGFEPKIHQHKRKTEPSEKKIYKKAVDGPRQKPSDADTIQRMLANLPAKRSRRSIVSLSDVLFKSRKNKKKTSPTASLKCGKKVRNKSQSETSKTNTNQQRNCRSLRSFNKVLASRILDLNSSLLVKRKMKVKRNQSLRTKSLPEIVPEEPVDDQKKRRPPKRDSMISSEPPEDVAEVKTRTTAKRMLTSRLNIKNFFPVKKKNSRSMKKNTDFDEVLNDEPSDINSHLQSLKNKKGGLKGFVRGLSLRKRSSKSDDNVSAVVGEGETSRTSRSKAKQIKPEQEVPTEPKETYTESKKRTIKRSFRNVINKVKKLKTEKTSNVNTKRKEDCQPFLEELKGNGQPVKVVIPTEVKDNPQGPENVPIAGSSTECAENPPIPETIFNLENNEETSMQAKGNVNFDEEHCVIKPLEAQENLVDCDTTPISIDAPVKPKSVPAVSPNVKGKMRKPSRGLNDCIAMLTSKLQQKDDKKSSSLESLFSTSSTTSTTELRPLAENSLVVPKVLPKIDIANKTDVEHAVLDLSKKAVSTPDLTNENSSVSSLPVALCSWTSVDSIIQQVVQNFDHTEAPKATRSTVDDIIDFVINNSSTRSESQGESNGSNLRHFRRSKRKKRSDDILITNIIFGKDKLIIAPSSNPKQDEDPLIVKIKQNEIKKAESLKLTAERKVIAEPVFTNPGAAVVRPESTRVKAPVEIKIGKAKKSSSVRRSKPTSESIVKQLVETDIDTCSKVINVPDKEPLKISTTLKDASVELVTSNEPIVMENKSIVKPISDSEDEVPLSVLVKDKAGDDGRLKDLNINEYNLNNCTYKEAEECLETVNTDSLKENVEEAAKGKAKAAKTAKRRKRRAFLGRKRLRDKNVALKPSENCSVASECILEPKNGVFALLESEQFHKITDSCSATPKGDPGETQTNLLLNAQRTRRKSKSSKKIENIENDLFKNFALVINKKTKRIPPTNIVDDSVSDDILDSNIACLNKLVNNGKNDELLNDSVEEIDMEIEDIPVNTCIIERDNTMVKQELASFDIAPNLNETSKNSLNETELKMDLNCHVNGLDHPIIDSLGELVTPSEESEQKSAAKDFEIPLKESTPKRRTSGRSIGKSDLNWCSSDSTSGESLQNQTVEETVINEEKRCSPRLITSSKDVSPKIPEEPKDLQMHGTEIENGKFEKPVKKTPNKQSKRKNRKTALPQENTVIEALMEDSGFVDKLQEDCQDNSAAMADLAMLKEAENEIYGTPVGRPEEICRTEINGEDINNYRANGQILITKDDDRTNPRDAFNDPLFNTNHNKLLRKDMIDDIWDNITAVLTPIKATEIDSLKSVQNEPVAEEKLQSAGVKNTEFSEDSTLVVDIPHADQNDFQLGKNSIDVPQKTFKIQESEEMQKVDLKLMFNRLGYEKYPNWSIEKEPGSEETLSLNDNANMLTPEESLGSRKQINYNVDSVSELSETIVKVKDNGPTLENSNANSICGKESPVIEDNEPDDKLPAIEHATKVESVPVDFKATKKRRNQKTAAKPKNNMDLDIANIIDADDDSWQRRSSRKRRSCRENITDLSIDTASSKEQSSVEEATSPTEEPQSLPAIEEFSSNQNAGEEVLQENCKSTSVKHAGLAEVQSFPESQDRQVELAKLNIKNLLFSSFAPPSSYIQSGEVESLDEDLEERMKVKLQKKERNVSRRSRDKTKKNKSLLNKNLSISTLKDVLESITKGRDLASSERIFPEIPPLTDIITSSEMDIAPVLDEIDKSLESEGIYDFTDDFDDESPPNEPSRFNSQKEARLSKPETKRSVRSAKLKALENIHEGALSESEIFPIQTKNNKIKPLAYVDVDFSIAGANSDHPQEKSKSRLGLFNICDKDETKSVQEDVLDGEMTRSMREKRQTGIRTKKNKKKAASFSKIPAMDIHEEVSVESVAGCKSANSIKALILENSPSGDLVSSETCPIKLDGMNEKSSLNGQIPFSTQEKSLSESEIDFGKARPGKNTNKSGFIDVSQEDLVESETFSVEVDAKKPESVNVINEANDIQASMEKSFTKSETSPKQSRRRKSKSELKMSNVVDEVVYATNEKGLAESENRYSDLVIEEKEKHQLESKSCDDPPVDAFSESALQPQCNIEKSPLKQQEEVGEVGVCSLPSRSKKAKKSVPEAAEIPTLETRRNKKKSRSLNAAKHEEAFAESDTTELKRKKGKRKREPAEVHTRDVEIELFVPQILIEAPVKAKNKSVDPTSSNSNCEVSPFFSDSKSNAEAPIKENKKLEHLGDATIRIPSSAAECHEASLEEAAELRRSRRGSRKVASYNENDLIDPLIDALENTRNRAARRENKNQAKVGSIEPTTAEKPKLTSEELFDLLKKSSFENEAVVTSKPISAFGEIVLNEDSSNSASRGLTDGSSDMDNQESFSESVKAQYADKIYEFTEESPDNSKEIFEISKKKSKPQPTIASPSIKSCDNNDIDSITEKEQSKSNYCEICKKSFIRYENLVKHKTTLTHISKLSELEAKEAEEKARLEKQNTASSPPSEKDNLRKFISISDILQTSEPSSNNVRYHEPSLRMTNSNSLKLVDIISDVLNKPVTSHKEILSDEQLEVNRRYKSLGERKSFESDTQLVQTPYTAPPLSQATILENQINLLENIIGANNNFAAEETSNMSNTSDADDANVDFVKPSQYEEISEDSTNAKISEEHNNKRKTLNRDEELFLECCSLLKSGSEVSNSNYSRKPLTDRLKEDEVDSKLVQDVENAHEYSDNSRTPTPLGDTFDDDASNSNTISSNWHLNSEKPMDRNQSYSFEEVRSKEEAGITFSEVLTQGLRNQFQGALKEDSPPWKYDGGEERKDDSDSSSASRKIATKGARKVYEGLKVSIPTDDINLDVLNGSKKTVSSADEDQCTSPGKTKTRKSKPVKKEVGINLLFKINKKRSLSNPTPPEKQQDIYNFDETQLDKSPVFSKPTIWEKKNGRDLGVVSDNESLGYADSIGADAKSVSSLSSTSAKSVRKAEPSPENITKKKYKIMGKIFRNAARSKMDEIEAELRSIPEIPEMDNLELVENYVRSCQRVRSPFLPPPPPPPLEELPKKPKMTEEEMNMLFDQLIGKDSTRAEKVTCKPPIKPKNNCETKKRTGKNKNRKRLRANSDSSGDEFNISRTTKKRSKKNNEEDSGINLELELKECIGVASRKSQRTCTSGKQNILVEYWSSDEEAFEAMLESNRLPPMTSTIVVESNENEEKVVPVMKKPVECSEKPKPPKRKAQPRKRPKASNTSSEQEGNPSNNRRKRTAANPLYHWSSSSEDESQSLIVVKPIREEEDDEDDEDRPVQHGWIVGDSPKKLVTMLALTKGKKSDFISVKEQGKKRASNGPS